VAAPGVTLASLASRLRVVLSVLLAPLVIAGCAQTISTIVATCSLDATLETGAAAPGDEVGVLGGPLTSDFDTVILVDGVQAEVTAVDRNDCGECDLCVVDGGCNACGECTICDDVCATCVEAARFIVPDVPGGVHDVVLINSYGTTEGLQLDVLGDTDGGDTDTGAPDTDTGLEDTDTGAVDSDTGVIDTDTAVIDTDTAVIDTDTAVIDTDTGVIDTDTAATDTAAVCDTATDTACAP
jgi:hypothetical protein